MQNDPLNRNEIFEELQKRVKEINESEGRSAEARILYLLHICTIFDRNYHELRRLLAAIDDSANLEIWDIYNPDKLEFVLLEIARLMQNFLSSAKALVDNTTRMLTHYYKGTDLYSKYEFEKNKRFKDESIVQFIHGLRNMSSHERLPFVRGQIHIEFNHETGEHKMDQRIYFTKGDLEESEQWNLVARKFLASAPDEIFIETVIDPYHTQIMDFANWLNEALRELHEEDLTLLEERRALCREMEQRLHF